MPMSTEKCVISRGRDKLRIMAVEPGIFRITFSRNENFPEAPSLMIEKTLKPIVFDKEETDRRITLRTDKIKVCINKKTLACTYFNDKGEMLLKENPLKPRELEETAVYNYIQGDGSKVTQRTTADGVRIKVENLEKEFARKAYHTKLNLCFDEDEAIMGLGSHEEGYLNLRGKSRFLYQQNMKACVPFFWSTKGYGVLIDSYTDMTFHDDGYGSYIWTDADGELDYYFIAGDSFDDIISRYRYLTGKVPMLPRWSFGYCQSKERYKTANELIEVAKEYRRRNIPLDLMILDWKSWEGELWGEKIFDASRFPDPSAMMKTLHELNVKLMISIWPHMSPGGENHKEFCAGGLMLLDGATYNAFDKAGRDMFWKQANEGLFSHGVDAWWCDCTEPFEADWIDSAVKPEPEARQRMNVEEACRYLDAQYNCAYSLMHSKGIYEGQRNASDKRVLNLTRSSYAGQQRYAAVTWSGDISANWQTLKKQIAEGLSFTSSGCPYWTLDIGGFFVKDWEQWYGDGHYDDGPADPEYRELFLRWFQYGAFLPMFRVHGTDFAREIWQFGREGELIYDTLAEFIRLRYRLMPYIYSLAHMVTEKDYTFLRSLAMDYPKNKKAVEVSDQFMLGPYIMVCPVYEKKCVSRKIYLPTEDNWYDFWTGKPVRSGEFVTDITLDKIPVYIKAGAILPLGPVTQHTGEKVSEPLELWVYPGNSSEFTIYDDDGHTYAYENGAYSKRNLKWDDIKKELSVEGEVFQGGIYLNEKVKTVVKGA